MQNKEEEGHLQLILVFSEVTANDHTMLKTPVLVRSPKFSNIGRG